MTAENVRQIESRCNLEIFHVFNDLRKSQLEVTLLRKENNKITTKNESLVSGRVQTIVKNDDYATKKIE